jgi:hypothetical protein
MDQGFSLHPSSVSSVLLVCVADRPRLLIVGPQNESEATGLSGLTRGGEYG